MSPAEATKVTPVVEKTEFEEVSLLASDQPKLIETTLAPLVAAFLIAANKSELLWLAAWTTTILAPGAIAWAHSISRASSLSQLLVPAVSVAPPLKSTFRKLGGSGMPNWASNMPKSLLLKAESVEG